MAFFLSELCFMHSNTIKDPIFINVFPSAKLYNLEYSLKKPCDPLSNRFVVIIKQYLEAYYKERKSCARQIQILVFGP